MKTFALLCVVSLQLGWSYGASKSNGVAAVAYQDSSGNRYGGTYGLNDEQVASFYGFPFAPQPYSYSNSNYDDFAPEFFRNLENLLQEAFYPNIRNQQLAYNAARKAFDLTSNQAGYFQPFPSRFQNNAAAAAFPNFPSIPSIPAIPGFPAFPTPTFDMPNFGDNSAFAAASLIPGMGHQIAAISPSNPSQPNINKVTKFSEASNTKPGVMSVSTSSFASSSDVNGKQVTSREAVTTIDKDGKSITYKVSS